MAERDLARMKCDPDRKFGAGTVFVVADDRKSEVGKLNADLVFASGLKVDLQHRLIRETLDDAVVKDCRDPVGVLRDEHFAVTFLFCHEITERS